MIVCIQFMNEILAVIVLLITYWCDLLNSGFIFAIFCIDLFNLNQFFFEWKRLLWFNLESNLYLLN